MEKESLEDIEEGLDNNPEYKYSRSKRSVKVKNNSARLETKNLNKFFDKNQ